MKSTANFENESEMVSDLGEETLGINAFRLSILIPTRTCDQLLASTLRNVTAVRSNEIEIVIVNNSDCDDVITRLDIRDRRVREVRSGPGLSMAHNWMVALREIKGDFFFFVGADDGIIASHLDEFLGNQMLPKVDAMTSHVIFVNHPSESERGYVDFPSKLCSRRVRMLRWPILSGALFHENSFDLPQPYNRAIVRSSLIQPLLELDRVPGFAPDVFLAHWIAQSSRFGVFYEETFFIHGGSTNSTGRTLTRNESSSFVDLHIRSVNECLSQWRKSVLPSCQLMGSLECAIIAFEMRKNCTLPCKFLVRFWVKSSCLEPCHSPKRLLIRRMRSFFVRWAAFLWRVRWMGVGGRQFFLHPNMHREVPFDFDLGDIVSYEKLIQIVTP